MNDLPATARDALRVFFALWPDGRALDGLAPWQARAHARCGGRPMRPDTLHLTLAFLGQATPGQVDALVAHTRGDRIAPGKVLLSRYGAFPKQGIVHAAPDPDASATQALHALNGRLWTALEALGWQREPRPFRPHVTLLRKADCSQLPDPPAEPVPWAYRQYVLVSSEPTMGTAHYRVLARSGEACAS